MADQNQGMQKILDEMALLVVTMEPDDIPALGNILNNLETVMAAGNEPEQWLKLAGAVRSIAEKMALFEADDPDAAFADLVKGVSMMQETSEGRCDGQGEHARIEEFSAGCGDFSEKTGQKDEPQINDVEDEKSCQADYDITQDRDIIESFIQEALEHLGTIEIHVLELENEPENTELVDAIFRPFHTVKGVSGFLNLVDINRLAHNIETVLDDARNSRLAVDNLLIDMVLDGVDLLRKLIDDLKERLETGRTQAGDFGIDDFLDRVRKIGALEEPEKSASSAEPEKPAGDGHDIGTILVRQGVVEQDDVKAALERQKAQDPLRQHMGEILIEEKKAGARDVAHAMREQKAARKNKKGLVSAGPGFVKVDTVKLDNMVDMAGELVINEAMIKQKITAMAVRDRSLAVNLAQFGRITSEIQKISMSMRMIPIKATFQRMIRLLRDLCAKSGKKTVLKMVGEDTEIDRNMVDMIYDPLVHMIRNSADHGIEMPEDRMAAGKSEAGTITLNAYHKGGNIVIEIVDDGKGLDREAIVASAISRNLIQSDENMSDQDVFGLIFQPGFSTAKKVTDVSGRGVGMDVVKRALDKLRGKVEVNSKLGTGTTILLKLPLTMAVIDGILIRAGEQSYVIPTVSVVESIRPESQDCTTVLDKGEMIMVRGSLYPLLRLHELFDFEPEHRNPWDAIIMIAESDGQRKCILVDEIIGKQEVVIKSLSGMLKNVTGLAGGAILANGMVGMILDVAGLFVASESAEINNLNQMPQAQAMPTPPAVRAQPRII